jgi:hypothetical protein
VIVVMVTADLTQENTNEEQPANESLRYQTILSIAHCCLISEQ